MHKLRLVLESMQVECQVRLLREGPSLRGSTEFGESPMGFGEFVKEIQSEGLEVRGKSTLGFGSFLKNSMGDKGYTSGIMMGGMNGLIGMAEKKGCEKGGLCYS